MAITVKILVIDPLQSDPHHLQGIDSIKKLEQYLEYGYEIHSFVYSDKCRSLFYTLIKYDKD